MLSYFPTPYQDELLYHIIARYHFALRNTDLRDTLREIFGNENQTPSISFPTGIAAISAHLHKQTEFSPQYLIFNHTLFPLYRPFLPNERARRILNQMINEKGIGIHATIGMMAGSICAKEALAYCPRCVSEDIESLGEPYFHRCHNAQGVMVCYIHGCLLKNYDQSYRTISRLEFIRLDKSKANLNPEYLPPDMTSKLHRIACSVNYLLTHPLIKSNQQSIHKKYLNLLAGKGYLTCQRHVKQQELAQDLIAFYGHDLLSYLQSDVIQDDQSNWLKSITRKPRKTVHPIRHILFINFLCQSIEEFCGTRQSRVNAFGEPPWYCLNPAADHYLEPVVNSCIITPDYKSRKPVGTFSCQCGFIYSRKGPDNNIEDAYKIGRIKQFGPVWEEKLKSLLIEGNRTLRELGREMLCDPKTIVKYAKKLSLDACLNSIMVVNDTTPMVKTNRYDQYFLKYSSDVLTFIKANPDFSKTAVRQALSKQCSWLYRNCREWYDKNLPAPNRAVKKDIPQRVDWAARDTSILFQLKSAFRELLQVPKPLRITRLRLAKFINQRAVIQRHLNKLPRTERFLTTVTESIGDFQRRRIDKASDDLSKEKGTFKAWEVIRKAGIRPEYVSNLMPRIEENIDLLESLVVHDNAYIDIPTDSSLLH
ncbi:MAG TPA: TnsD family transposase [Desulfosporosinus sp.]|nr:TnsD family transposase [Desulfosporosinus sp.]